MKKIALRGITITLVMVMCICMAIPAFALAEPWNSQIREFPTVQYSSDNSAVWALQHFLGRYSNKTYSEIGANGCDGVFGPATLAAVKLFQTETQGEQYADGICGPNTWGCMTGFLTTSRIGGSDYTEEFYCDRYSSAFTSKIFFASVVNGIVTYYPYTAYGQSVLTPIAKFQ